jgi:hypothetical protein
MATFYEIYQNYLQNPYGGVNALPGVNAISGTMGATPISSMSGGDGIGEVSSVSPVGSVSNVSNVGGFGNVDTSAKGIAGLAASGLIGGPFGLAANVVGQMIGMPSVSDVVGRAMAGLGIGGGDSTSTGTANATDTGDMGSEAANNAATDAANASAGVGDGGGPGGGDSGDTGGPFRDGGRVGLYDGGSAFDNYRALNLGGRIGYAEGGTGPSPDAAETYSEYKARMLEALRKSHGGQKTAYTDVQPDGSSSGISRDLPIEDYFNYMLADAYALGFNPNTGLKFGVDDRGVLTDQYKFKQEMADFKKNSQTTPTEDFSDYLNTTTINTNVQTTPTEDFSDYINFTTSRGGQYAIDPSSILDRDLESLNTQTTPTEDFSDYLNTTTINTIAQTAPTVAEQMISPEDALTPEIPSNNVLDQWKAHAEATQAMKGETGLDAIPEYGFQTGYDFQSKFPNLDPRIGAGLASGYQVLTEGLGMFNPNNPNFLNPAAAYKTALSDATKNIEGIMAFDQNLMTPEQQENRNKYLKSVGQNIPQTLFPQGDFLNIRERPLESAFERFTGAAGPLAENINTAISSLNPFQKQQYMNYAVQNPDQAIAAAQRNKDFLAATQKNTNPATSAPASMADGGRVFYLQGGLASLLG